MSTGYTNFDQWFEDFESSVRSKGYLGPIDRDAFEAEYELGMTPENSAIEFVDEMSN